MADTSNLTNFLQDVADAIKEKKEYDSSQKIAAADFDTEIASIETGIDTSDATATANDIIYDKTAYVDGVKVTGAMIPQYRDNGEIRVLSQVTNSTDRPIYGVVNDICCISISGTTVYINALDGDQTGDLIMSVSMEDISVTATNIHDADISDVSVNDDGETYNIIVGGDTGSNWFWAVFQVNINDKTYTKLGDGTEVYGSYSGKESPPYVRFATNSCEYLVRTRSGSSSYWCYCTVWFGKIVNNTVNFFFSNQWEVNDRNVHNNLYTLLLDVKDTHIGVYTQWYYNDNYVYRNNKIFNVNWDAGTASLLLSTSDKLCVGDNFFLRNNKIYAYSDINNPITTLSNYTYDTVFGMAFNYKDYIISFVPSGGMYYIYRLLENYTLTLQSSNAYVNSKTFYHTQRNMIIPKLTKDGLFYETATGAVGYNRLQYHLNTKTLSSLNANGIILHNTEYADALAGNLLSGKVAYTQNGLLYGSMPNNGALNYTPIEETQTIPAGYTSGGTITSITTSQDYQNCLTISEEILE